MRIIRVGLLSFLMLLGMSGMAFSADFDNGRYSMKDGDVELSSGHDRQWYVRGDVGYGLNLDGEVSDSIIAQGLAPAFINTDWDEAWSIGGGIGLYINPRIRLDFTLDYRMNADVFSQLPPPATLPLAAFTAEMDSLVGLANVYYDFDFGSRFTPYVGAGIGFVHHSFDGEDTNDDDADLAWALMAGVAVDFGENWKVDVGYRYLDMGDVKLDDRKGSGKRFLMDEIETHEIRVGVRYGFSCWSRCEDSYESMK